MEKYELLYILAAKYTDEEINALIEKFKGVVTSLGGNVTETHNLGRRKLAYPIGHVRNGNYVLNYFEADTAAMAKINDTLRLSVDILRHLIVVRSPHLKSIPSFADLPEIRTADEQQSDAMPLRRPRQMAPVAAPAAKAAAPVSMEEIDKKLDAILNEDVK